MIRDLPNPIRAWLRVAAVVAMGACVLPAENTLREFEAASLKLLRSDDTAVPVQSGGPGTSTPSRVRYRGLTLTGLLNRALGTSPDQVVGPRWMREDKYAFEAVVPKGATEDGFREMLWGLLQMRFSLETHPESREFTVYNLVIMPGGHKLKPSVQPGEGETGDWDGTSLGGPTLSGKLDDLGCPVRPPGSRGAVGTFGGHGCMAYRRYTMSELARNLGSMVAIDNLSFADGTTAHVTDRTGLVGEFDFNLKYNRAARLMMAMPNLPKLTDEPAGASLAEALRSQLGLNLQKTRATMKVLVIDRATRTPAEN